MLRKKLATRELAAVKSEGWQKEVRRDLRMRSHHGEEVPLLTDSKLLHRNQETSVAIFGGTAERFVEPHVRFFRATRKEATRWTHSESESDRARERARMQEATARLREEGGGAHFPMPFRPSNRLRRFRTRDDNDAAIWESGAVSFCFCMDVLIGVDAIGAPRTALR